MLTNELKLVLAIPTFNCANEILLVFEDLRLNQLPINEIWVIDNCSEDGTLEILKEYLSKSHSIYPVRVYRNQKNRGLGGTHKIIFSKLLDSKFDAVIVLHGDFQARAIDLKKMIPIQNKFYNRSILGSRFMRDSHRVNYSMLRLIWNLIFNNIMTIRYLIKVHDLGSGLNIFPTSVVKKLDYSLLPDDLTFNVELLKCMFIKKLFPIWFPIHWVSENQVSNVKVLSQTAKTIKLIMWKNFNNKTTVCSPELVGEF